MFNLTPATRIFVCAKPIDMRKSFNGLFAMAQRANSLGSRLWEVFNEQILQLMKETTAPAAPSQDNKPGTTQKKNNTSQTH